MFILHLTLFKFKKIHDLLAFDFSPVACWTSTCSDRLMAIATTTCRRTIMNRRNDHQNPHRPKTTWAGQLVCPHCQTAFPSHGGDTGQPQWEIIAVLKVRKFLMPKVIPFGSIQS
jgi:hypothetical protein